MKTCIKCGVEGPETSFKEARNVCKACEAVRKRALYEANRETTLAKLKADYAANPEAKKARTRASYEANREAAKAWANAYRRECRELVNGQITARRKARPHIHRAVLAKRRTAKIRRKPTWLSPEQYEQIKAVYAESARLTEETGVEHHVDHIVPLQGQNVSGLHVPWNLRAVPAKENLSKGNRYDGPDSWAA